MKIDTETRISFPRELVFRTYRDRLPELIPHLPNVRSIEVARREDEGDLSRLENVWTATGAELPSAVRGFVKPEMLAWTDTAEWNAGAFRCAWRIETHAMPGVVECSGQNLFEEDGDSTRLRITGDLLVYPERAKVPRLLAGTLRPMVEKLIVSVISKNLVTVGGGLERFLQSEAGR